MSHAAARLTPEDLDAFRQVQRLAYECAETIAGELKPGMTERRAAALQKTWLLDHGVDDWFHQPFAWFGDRTAFRGLVGVKQLGGYTADIGYCCVLGSHPVLDRMMDDLADYRRLILDMARQRRPLSEISQAVDALCARQGYDPRHKAYPFETLAHRVEKLEDDGKKDHLSLFNFGVRNVTELVKDRFKGASEGWSPIWNSSKRSEHPPTPGLWAVEPHLGLGPVGAKWEELLVVTEVDAFWLDDDVPHVRRWQQRGLWQTAAA